MKIQARYMWCLSACLLVPTLASAAVMFSIDDRGDGNPILVGTSPFGFDATSLNVQLNPESADVHGEYLSTLNLANGTSVTANFNFMEPTFEEPAGVALISDTLNIVFTGHTATTADPNNISVDLHFRSDSDPTGLPGLTNAISLAETGGFQNLTSMIQQATNVADFNLSVASDVVPEPSTWGLVLIGAGLLIGRVRRRHS